MFSCDIFFRYIFHDYYIIGYDSQAIYTTTERSKYPSDERLMQVCYNALLNANGEEFQNKMEEYWIEMIHP